VSALDFVHNLGLKAARRLGAAHKPFVRLARRHARQREHAAFARDAAATEAAIAAVARSGRPIVAGPWLAEVGYEVLYWLPFLRWFQDAYQVPRERLIALSRGGLEAAYRECAASYVDIFDLVTPAELAARNRERRDAREGGGQKQSDLSVFDGELLQETRRRAGQPDAVVLHPSLMFRLFRHVWHGNLPMDLFWRHVRYRLVTLEDGARPAGLVPPYVAAKIYGGPALGASAETREAVRAVVVRVAATTPVVLLDPPLVIDEHRDFDLSGIAGVTSLAHAMTPRTNLGVQLETIAGASSFLGTCGGLAWLAPFLGVPTVALYDTDALLATHLLIARQAGDRAGAADFMPLDLRALGRAGVLARRGHDPLE
jgi:hypothetical protein